MDEKDKNILNNIIDKIGVENVIDIINADANYIRGLKDSLKLSRGEIKGLNKNLQYVKGFLKGSFNNGINNLLVTRPLGYNIHINNKKEIEKNGCRKIKI